VRLLQKELQMRTRIASDLHDEVGGSLTGLYLQMQMIEMQVPEKEKTSLSKANAIINESITKMRDLVWSIDARSDSWGKILERMQDYASDVLSPLDIRFSFQHHQIDTSQHIDARMKHNIYLIFKEAIHNIAKHSHAATVDIILEQTAGVLNMTIQDDGKSTPPQNTSTGQGLNNMKMRAAQLKGKLTAGYTEKGFMVSLKIPVTG
jgi:signal transduction histidine kinase